MTSVVRGMRKSYLLSDMGFKPASEIEPPADRRVAHRKTPAVSCNSRGIDWTIPIKLCGADEVGVGSPVPIALILRTKEKKLRIELFNQLLCPVFP